MDGACSTSGGEDLCIKGLVGKPEGKRPLGRPRRRWEDNIKMDLKGVGWVELSGLIWLRIGEGSGRFKCANEPSDFIKCGEFLDQLRTG